MAGRILVLDDEENYAEMLRDLLVEHNYRVDMATRPERALDQLEEIPYDLVVADYKMPVMDGADLLKRSRELYPNLPFILVSGLMNTPELVKVANMSVTLVIEKPLDTEDFLGQVARFSSPMTEEEKETLAGGGEDGSVSGETGFTYPGKPRFYNAGNVQSKQFLEDLWQAGTGASHVFVFDCVGGDASLAARDFSVWRTGEDSPVADVAAVELLAKGADALSAAVRPGEHSPVITVTLDSPDQLGRAREFVRDTLPSLEGPDGMCLVFLLASDRPHPELTELAGGGVANPPLALRPFDAASYADRIAHRAAERLGKTGQGDFSAESAFALLYYDWPGNYAELRQVVADAVENGPDGPVSLDLLEKRMGMGSDAVPAPGARLRALLERVQRSFLRHAATAEGRDCAELARLVDGSEEAGSADGLDKLPLYDQSLTWF